MHYEVDSYFLVLLTWLVKIIYVQKCLLDETWLMLHVQCDCQIPICHRAAFLELFVLVGRFFVLWAMSCLCSLWMLCRVSHMKSFPQKIWKWWRCWSQEADSNIPRCLLSEHFHRRWSSAPSSRILLQIFWRALINAFILYKLLHYAIACWDDKAQFHQFWRVLGLWPNGTCFPQLVLHPSATPYAARFLSHLSRIHSGKLIS